MIITRWTHVLNANWSIEIMFQFHPIILICRKITVLWRFIMIKVSRDFEHKLIDVKQQSLWLLTQYLIIGIRNFRTKNNLNAHIPILWHILPNLNVSISIYCPIYIGFDSPNQMVYQTHRANNIYFKATWSRNVETKYRSHSIMFQYIQISHNRVEWGSQISIVDCLCVF
jgi:hypothetical protein